MPIVAARARRGMRSRSRRRRTRARRVARASVLGAARTRARRTSCEDKTLRFRSVQAARAHPRHRIHSLARPRAARTEARARIVHVAAMRIGQGRFSGVSSLKRDRVEALRALNRIRAHASSAVFRAALRSFISFIFALKTGL
ncbi:hypothetical protein RDV84_03125 [Lysobacter yananisis]|uniref:Uncharacterized protein n=1 Tax=Lysobacter yananisis TaxID=1003114 RepID=A0ABY9PCE9_9GAMM|nr:hypothetical protein [Lysobacter yananisis]WMT03851.1 hypothetical protein RDV84_03125 [Lysobacter yananisis]